MTALVVRTATLTYRANARSSFGSLFKALRARRFTAFIFAGASAQWRPHIQRSSGGSKRKAPVVRAQ